MIIQSKAELILASSSKIRKKILQDSGLTFKVIKPLYDEDIEKKKLAKLTPQKLATFLASQKALSVSHLFPSSYVIGCDQVCEFEKKEISKSKNQREAISQLKKFNGKTHFQNNAVVVALNRKIIFKNFSLSKLEMRKMKIAEIEKYVQLEKPWGCAGSYQYESLGKHLFAKVYGDYFSILGIAIQPLLAFLYSQKIIKF
jgi:septum formation protein